MPHYITWADFCGPRAGKLRFDLPPPNDGVDFVGDLVYGRQAYDTERLAYSKAFTAWWAAGKPDPPPTHWRVVVRDKWAGIRICEHPEIVLPGHNRPLLYDAGELYELLISTPRVVNATHQAAEQGGRMGPLRDVQAAVESVFRNEFKLVTQAGGYDYQLVMKFFDHSLDLIARWLLLHYELYPLWWGPMVAQYAEVSEEWRQYMQHATEQGAIADGRATEFTPRKPKNREPKNRVQKETPIKEPTWNPLNLLDQSRPQP